MWTLRKVSSHRPFGTPIIVQGNSGQFTDAFNRFLDSLVAAVSDSAVVLFSDDTSTTAQAVYTSAGTTTEVTGAALTNSGSAATFSMWLVPRGASRTDANRLYDTEPIAAGATYTPTALIGQGLRSGEALHVQSSSALAFRLSGRSGS